MDVTDFSIYYDIDSNTVSGYQHFKITCRLFVTRAKYMIYEEQDSKQEALDLSLWWHLRGQVFLLKCVC